MNPNSLIQLLIVGVKLMLQIFSSNIILLTSWCCSHWIYWIKLHITWIRANNWKRSIVTRTRVVIDSIFLNRSGLASPTDFSNGQKLAGLLNYFYGLKSVVSTKHSFFFFFRQFFTILREGIPYSSCFSLSALRKLYKSRVFGVKKRFICSKVDSKFEVITFLTDILQKNHCFLWNKTEI
jgi:hypothetical protein